MDKPLLLFPYSIDQLTGIIRTEVREAVSSIKIQASTPPRETLLSRRETADKLKISLVTLNDWTKRGLIQSYLIGGRVLYKDSEIEASLYKTQTVKY